MDDAIRQMTKAQLKEEERALKEIKKMYEKARKDVETQISALNARKDMQNLQSIIYQKKYQEAILKQIDGVLDELNKGQFETTQDFLNSSYSNGYIGMMYDLQKTTGCTVVMPIDPKKVIRAVKTDSKLSERYYQNRELPENLSVLKRNIRQQITRGIASEKTWTEVAYQIAQGMNSPFNKAMSDAMRIVRTEGHRVNQEGFLDAGNQAKKNGADIVKQWDATLDRKTRPWHQEADGQIREWDEYFIVGGEKMKAPSIGGSARNVCNCRCQLLQRAKWALDEAELKTLQDRASFFGLDKSDSFEDFKKKYLKLPENADTIKIRPSSQYTGHPDCKLAKALGADDYEKMLETMDEKCSEPSVRKMWDIFEEGIDGDFQYKGHEKCSGTSKIYVNVTKDAKGSDWQSPFQVICHESGHSIDRKSRNLGEKYGWGLSSTYDGGVFQKTLKQEIMDRIDAIDKAMKAEYKAHKDDPDWLQKNGHVNSWTGSMMKYSKLRAYETFQAEIRNIPRNARADISDIVEGATKGKVKGGFGHGNSYWKDDENLALEAFAEMTDATLANPENLEQIKKYVPKSYKIYLEIVDLIVKGK